MFSVFCPFPRPKFSKDILKNLKRYFQTFQRLEILYPDILEIKQFCEKYIENNNKMLYSKKSEFKNSDRIALKTKEIFIRSLKNIF